MHSNYVIQPHQHPAYNGNVNSQQLVPLHITHAPVTSSRTLILALASWTHSYPQHVGFFSAMIQYTTQYMHLNSADSIWSRIHQKICSEASLLIPNKHNLHPNTTFPVMQLAGATATVMDFSLTNLAHRYSFVPAIPSVTLSAPIALPLLAASSPTPTPSSSPVPSHIPTNVATSEYGSINTINGIVNNVDVYRRSSRERDCESGSRSSRCTNSTRERHISRSPSRSSDYSSSVESTRRLLQNQQLVQLMPQRDSVYNVFTGVSVFCRELVVNEDATTRIRLYNLLTQMAEDHGRLHRVVIPFRCQRGQYIQEAYIYFQHLTAAESFLQDKVETEEAIARLLKIDLDVCEIRLRTITTKLCRNGNSCRLMPTGCSFLHPIQDLTSAEAALRDSD